ncbi:acyl-CoA dehydrogenase family protein [Goodfellowiella coeruleoviolacea]|uniref:Acyl-CoA dehydrogenase n=1 Tax=Goodfellowiella coeruleoviolacea TaxID=334858 RepID=A0AAE3KJF1_9PSEU|nr:acyl-CoA dehydrogenase family protein [Goodfellowiella coeruleoviolacea]MCP2164228.1 Acyl-CoA dehydrogenase [Goodfellowiella coeruleoviolacea]
MSTAPSTAHDHTHTAGPDLLYSEVEDELRASVRALLADHCAWPTVLARVETDEPYDVGLWRRLAAEVGVAGLAVPEAEGGAGASWREVAVVAEELGRAVAPVPFLGSAVLSTVALLAVGDSALVGDLASGTRTAALAVPLSTAPDAAFPGGVRVEPGEVLTGAVTSVADVLPADVLLVPALGEAGPALYAVDRAAEGVTLTGVSSLDLTRRLADVTLRAAPGRLLASGTAARDALRGALHTGAALLASEQLGLAEQALATTVDYLRTRHQFGRPVGSFQALKHRLADLWVGITQARAVARYAVGTVADGDPDAGVAVAVAQSFVSELAVLATEEMVQLHGGVGFTWEHPAHLYLKRAKADAIALGSADHHRASLAGLIDLPGVPAVR